MAKHLFYLNDWELSAYLHEGGVLKRQAAFQDGFGGREALANFLSASDGHAAYLLADLAEEDFQLEVLPHVSGRAQRALTGRRLQQFYRDTPYKRAASQGREQGGRKDDRILFSALTKPAVPRAWLGTLSQCEVPLAGLYSLALLTEQLHKALRLPSEALLLITHQSSGLRQSYFHQGRLVFSRLTQLLNEHPDRVAVALLSEISKTREFLASTRQLPREQRLDVAVLAGASMLAPLRASCQDSDSMRYRLVTLEEAVKQLGLKLAEPAEVCDSLFLGLLASKAPAAHYPTAEQTRLYSLWRTRFALKAMGGVAVMAAFAWTGLNAYWGWEQYEKIRALGADTLAADTEYRTVLRNTPVSDVSGRDMGVAVKMGELLRENGVNPEPMLEVLSSALATMPQVSVDRLHWQTQRPGSAALAAAPAPAARPETQQSAALVGLPQKPEQVLTVEGHIVPFQGDFRRALKEVQRLADALQSAPKSQVKIVQLPLDITPAGKIEGKAGSGTADAKAAFSLQLIWIP